MLCFTAFFARFFIERGHCSEYTADKTPKDLDLRRFEEKIKGICQDEYAEQSSDSNRNEIDHVLNEILPQVGKKVNHPFVNTEYGSQCTAAYARKDRTRAYEHSFYKPKQPVNDFIFFFLNITCHIFTCISQNFSGIQKGLYRYLYIMERQNCGICRMTRLSRMKHCLYPAAYVLK